MGANDSFKIGRFRLAQKRPYEILAAWTYSQSVLSDILAGEREEEGTLLWIGLGAAKAPKNLRKQEAN